MAWIQVEDSIKEHDKIYDLADILKISNAHAVGLMVCLWTWVAVNAPDGDVSSYPPRAISKAAGWEKKAQLFYDALIKVKFLEIPENGRVIVRNWENRAALLIDLVERQREATRKRVQRHRERKKAKTGALQDGTCNVTVTPGNATTITKPKPNLNQTQPKPNHNLNNSSAIHNPSSSTVEGENPSSGDDVALRPVLEKFAEDIHTAGPGETEILRALCEEYGQRSLLAAIEEARGKGRSANYIKTMLAAWRDSGRTGRSDSDRPPSYDIEAYNAITIQEELELLETEIKPRREQEEKS